MKKYIFIILGIFLFPQVSFGAVLYDNSLTGDTLSSYFRQDIPAGTGGTFSTTNPTFYTTTGNETILRTKIISGTCSTMASKLNVSDTSYVNIYTATSASLNGEYCDFTSFSPSIPNGINLGFLSWSSSTYVDFAGSSYNDGYTYVAQVNPVIGGTAFQLCDSGGCSGGFSTPSPSITLDFPTATSTMSGFDNWVTSWSNASTSYSQPIIYYSASSTVLSACRDGFQGNNSGYGGLYYCPYGTSTYAIYRDFGPQYVGLDSFTNTITKNKVLDPATYYVFAGLDDYSIGYGLAVSPLQQFTINATSSYAYATSTTASTTPIGIASTLNFDCSSDSIWFGAVYEGTCKALKYLFIPDGPTIATYWDYAWNNITTSFPIGYVTDFVTIMSTTTASSLTVIDATIPTGIAGAGASIHLDLANVLDPFLYATTSSFVNSSASSTDTFYDITSVYWNKIVWFLFFMYILTRILGTAIIPNFKRI